MKSDNQLSAVITNYLAVAGNESSINIKSNFNDVEPGFRFWNSDAITAHGVICDNGSDLKHIVLAKILETLVPQAPDTIWITDSGTLEDFAQECSINYIQLATEPFTNPFTGALQYPLCLNPFWLSKDSEGRNVRPCVEDLNGITGILYLMMESMEVKKNTNSEYMNRVRSLLYYSVNEFYSEWLKDYPDTEPRFRDFIPYLIQTNFETLTGMEIASRLTLFYGNGPFAPMFDGELQLTAGNGVTLFGTERIALSPALEPVVLTLATILSRKCRYELKRDNKKALLLNHNLARHAETPFIVPLSALYREFRQHGCSCTLVCRDLCDFLSFVNEDPDQDDGISINTSHHFYVDESLKELTVSHKPFAGK